MREQILAVLLAIAGTLIVVGIAKLSAPAGFLAAGVLLGLWSWLVFGELGDDAG